MDNINSYYDPALKQARLDQLQSDPNFSFNKLDISNSDELNKTFKDFKPQKVVNLAAQAGVRYSLENPQAYIESNVVGFMNILECCRHHDVEGLIYASSSSVYGGNEKIPFSVDDRVDRPISIYAATKISNELMAHSYSHLFGLNTTFAGPPELNQEYFERFSSKVIFPETLFSTSFFICEIIFI